MVQVLLNNLNIQNKAASISSNYGADNSKTDFQALFDKQNQIAGNLNKDNTNEETAVEGNSTNSTSIFSNNKDKVKEIDEKREVQTPENPTFAGSIINDIKQLINFLQSQENSAHTEETAENTETEEDLISAITTDSASQIEETTAGEMTSGETTETDNMDAEKIAKKLLHLEDDEDDDEESEAENMEVKTDENPQTKELITNSNINNFINNFEVIADDAASAASEISEQAKTAEAEAEQTIEDIIDEEQLKELNIESIEVETADSGTGDLMQHQSPEEQGVKAMLQADYTEVKTEVKPAEVQNAPKAAASGNVTTDKLMEQITKHIESLYNGSKVNMVLNPESLGKVSIQLINTKEGLSAQFTTMTQEARNLIMNGLDNLKDTLLSHGVNVDNVSVKLNDTQESKYNADWTEQEGSRGGNKEQGSRRGQRDKESFENLMSFIEDEEN